MGKPESFEVTEYGTAHEDYDTLSVIRQIIQDLTRDNPAASMSVSFTGDMIKLTYSSFEMLLPTRIKEVEARSVEVFRDVVKHLKKEFKSKTKRTLTLKEKEELADYTVQKVSLNERYYYICWRHYELE